MRNIIQTLYATKKQAYLSDVLGLRNFQRCWGSISNSETTDTRKYIEILEKYLSLKYSGTLVPMQ